MKEVWIQFSEEANTEYIELQQTVIQEQHDGKENSPNMQLLKAIEREKNNLKIDPQHGTTSRERISQKMSSHDTGQIGSGSLTLLAIGDLFIRSLETKSRSSHSS